jgi:hypothetical protein
MPLIPATWEAEIGKIMVRDQPSKNKQDHHLSNNNNNKKLGMDPSYSGGIIKNIMVQSGSCKNERPYLKNS